MFLHAKLAWDPEELFLIRLARTCSAYPRLGLIRSKAWMAGTRPAKTKLKRRFRSPRRREIFPGQPCVLSGKASEARMSAKLPLSHLIVSGRNQGADNGREAFSKSVEQPSGEAASTTK
jgi:hypothetical protein